MTGRLRILMVIRSLGIGGAERQLVMMTDGLKARGHDVSVAVLYPGGGLERSLRAIGVAPLSLEKRGRWDVVGPTIRLARLVRRTRPDIVYTLMDGANLLGAFAAPFWGPTRLVWGIRIANRDTKRYGRFDVFLARLQISLARTADLLIANSDAGRDELRGKGVPAQMAISIPNVIRTDYFMPDPQGRRTVREEWGIADDIFLTGIVARFNFQKDYPTFLRAAARALAGNPALRFVCVGTGPRDLEWSYRSLADKLGLAGKIVWAGARSDMPAVFSALDLLCAPSLFEGFSNSVAEAMSCEVRAVVTDVGDSRRIVGDTGWVIAVGDIVALEASILEASRGAAGKPSPRRRIIESFSASAVMGSMEQAFRSLLA